MKVKHSDIYYTGKKIVYIFIINPVAGMVDKTDQIRFELERRRDVQAIIFNTEDAGHEYELMKEMLEIFDDEEVRIIICGGSGTLSNAINALYEEDLSHIEIGFYPCGLTNDFLKNFGMDKVLFENINAIIDGKSKYVDYVRCKDSARKHTEYNELLFSTVGIPAQIQDMANSLNLIGKFNPTILYGLCSFISTPISRACEYEVDIDGVDYSGEYKVIYVGNSVCLGGGFFPIKKNVSCQDGMLNILLLKKFPAYRCINYLLEFMHGTLPEKHPKDVIIAEGTKISFKRKDKKPMVINSDGEIFRVDSWTMEVMHNQLRFIVPDGAKIVDDVEELINCEGFC